MVQPLDYLPETPSQTAGPYVHIGCTPNFVGIHGMKKRVHPQGGVSASAFYHYLG